MKNNSHVIAHRYLTSKIATSLESADSPCLTEGHVFHLLKSASIWRWSWLRHLPTTLSHSMGDSTNSLKLFSSVCWRWQFSRQRLRRLQKCRLLSSGKKIIPKQHKKRPSWWCYCRRSRRGTDRLRSSPPHKPKNLGHVCYSLAAAAKMRKRKIHSLIKSIPRSHYYYFFQHTPRNHGAHL